MIEINLGLPHLRQGPILPPRPHAQGSRSGVGERTGALEPRERLPALGGLGLRATEEPCLQRPRPSSIAAASPAI